ncbi:hypothetical protein CMT75_18780 [Elizabethkingia anophelis]|nr:hypothetical protein [Elizabethkingia anophelis]
MENQKMYSWAKALQEIDIEEYFQYKFPHFYYDSTRKAYVDHSDPSLRTDKIVFFKGKDGFRNFISRNDSRNSGNLISLIKKLVLKNSPDWKIGVNLELENYSKILPELDKLQKSESKALVIHNNAEITEQYQIEGKFYPLHQLQKNYLIEDRKISESTLNSAVFKDVAKSYKRNDENFYTLAYPIIDQQKNIVGVNKINTNKDYSNYNIKRFEKNSNNSIGFTHSNFLTTSKTLITCESLIDAMSHFDLQLNNTNIEVLERDNHYMISNGELSANKAFLVVKDFKNLGFKNLVLANDNDLAGSRFDLNILNALLSNIKVQYMDTLFFNVTIKITDDVNKDEFSKGINSFISINEEVTTFINDMLPSDLAKKFIEDEKVIVWMNKNKPDEYEFFIPNDRDYLQVFNQTLIQSHYSISQNIKVEKSIAKDWNEDLKQSKNTIKEGWNIIDKPKNRLKI